MKILCSLSRHFPDGNIITNQTDRFSKCARCSTDLIESHGKWVAAPKGFRIVWRSTAAAQNDLPATESAELVPTVVEVNRGLDRRQPGPAIFSGPEKRRMGDRRARFGKVETLVERDGVRITREGAAFPTGSFNAHEILTVRLSTQRGEFNLTWLLYAALAVLTGLQAAMSGDPILWAITIISALVSSLKWPQRQSPDRYDILVESGNGPMPVLQTWDKGFATLVHDAVAAIQRNGSTGRA